MRLVKSKYLILASLALVGMLSSNHAHADDAPSNPLIDLSLEELLKITVTTGSKSKETLTEIPASVTVINRAQIEASGWRNLAAVLNAQTGFYTFSDRIYDFVVPRGNYQTNDPNSRILLLLNGHSVIESFGYFNGHLPSVDINHIERIEIVRGPGSAIYGTNAMFAVINVITSKKVEQATIDLTLEYGDHQHQKLAFRGDWPVSGGAISVMASGFTGGENELFFDEYVGSPHPLQGQTLPSNNREKLTNFLFNAQVDDWNYSSYFNRRTKHVPTGVFGGSIGEQDTFFQDTNVFFELSRKYQLSKRNSILARSFYDFYDFKGRFFFIPDPNGLVGPPYDSEFNRVTDASFGLELIVETQWNDKLQSTSGIEYKKYDDVDFIYVSENDPLQLLNERFSFDPDESITSLFTSLSYKWGQDWSSVFGLHYDYYNTVGGHLSLRGSIAYQYSPRSLIKLVYGEAFRAPNSWELNGGFFLIGNPNLSPETSDSLEFILDYSINDNWHWQGSVFHYSVANNIRKSNDGVEFINAPGMAGSGLETEVRFSKERNSGSISFSYSDVEDEALSQRRSFYPDTQLKLSYIRNFHDDLFLSVESFWIGERYLADQSQGKLPAYNHTNLSLYGFTLWKEVQASLSVHNVFDESYQHPSFISDLASFNVNATHPVYDIPADGRHIQLRLNYNF